MHSVLKLIECSFVKVSTKFPDNKPYFERCSIEDITFSGYRFIESIREPSVWEKTQSIIGKVGNHTFDVIFEVL